MRGHLNHHMIIQKCILIKKDTQLSDSGVKVSSFDCIGRDDKQWLHATEEGDIRVSESPVLSQAQVSKNPQKHFHKQKQMWGSAVTVKTPATSVYILRDMLTLSPPLWPKTRDVETSGF